MCGCNLDGRVADGLLDVLMAFAELRKARNSGRTERTCPAEDGFLLPFRKP